MTYSWVASLMLSIESWRKDWSPHAIRFSTYFRTTVFWYATVRYAAIRCGSKGWVRQS